MKRTEPAASIPCRQEQLAEAWQTGRITTREFRLRWVARAIRQPALDRTALNPSR